MSTSTDVHRLFGRRGSSAHPFAAWSFGEAVNWQDAIAALADTVLFDPDHTPAEYDEFKQKLAPLAQSDWPRFIELESFSTELGTPAVMLGALLGFGLARTWPASIEEVDGWVERAIAYVGAEHFPPALSAEQFVALDGDLDALQRRVATASPEQVRDALHEALGDQGEADSTTEAAS